MSASIRYFSPEFSNFESIAIKLLKQEFYINYTRKSKSIIDKIPGSKYAKFTSLNDQKKLMIKRST